MVNTTTAMDGRLVSVYVGLGAHVVKHLFAGLGDIVGCRPAGYERSPK
jgi:uncharacterized protein YbjQ (UPF0145 family)